MAAAPAAATGRNSRSQQRPAGSEGRQDPGEEQCRSDGGAEQRTDRRGTGEQHPDLRLDTGDEPHEDRHDDRRVDRDDGVLGAEADTAGQTEHGDDREPGQHLERQRLAHELCGHAVWPAVAGQHRERDADGETGQGEDQDDPPSRGIHAERPRQRRPQHAAEQIGHLLEPPQQQRAQHSDEDRRHRHRQQAPRRHVRVCLRSREAHLGPPSVVPIGPVVCAGCPIDRAGEPQAPDQTIQTNAPRLR